MAHHRRQVPPEIAGDRVSFRMQPNPLFGLPMRPATAPVPVSEESKDDGAEDDSKQYDETASFSMPADHGTRVAPASGQSHTFPRARNPFKRIAPKRSATQFNILDQTIQQVNVDQHQNDEEVLSPYGDQPEYLSPTELSHPGPDRFRGRSPTNLFRREPPQQDIERQLPTEDRLRNLLVPNYEQDDAQDARFEEIRRRSHQRFESFTSEAASRDEYPGSEDPRQFDTAHGERFQLDDLASAFAPENWRMAEPRTSAHLGRTPQQWRGYEEFSPDFGGEPGPPIREPVEHVENPPAALIEPSLTVAAAAVEEHDHHGHSLASSSDNAGRHYEGCMLCDPLSTPELSETDSEELGRDIQYATGGHPGPPPDEPPAPSAIKLGKRTVQPRSTDPILIEGEIARASDMPMIGGEVVRNGGQYRQDPYSALPTGTRSIPGPSEYPYRDNAGKSLSTLQERDEFSSRGMSRMPSAAGEPIPLQDLRNMSTFGSVADDSRPTTGYSDEMGRHLLSRSSQSMSQARTRRPSRLNAVQESLATMKNSLRGKPATPTGFNPRAEPGLQTPPPVLRFREADSDPHPGFRRDRLGEDGTYEMVDMSAPMDPRTNTVPDDMPGLPRPAPTHQARGIRRFFPSRSRPTTPAPRDTPARQHRDDEMDNWASKFLGRFCGIHATRGNIIVGSLIMLAIIIVILSSVLPAIFVGWPRAAQKALDGATIEVTNVTFIDVQPTVAKMVLDLQLSENGTNKSSQKFVRVSKLVKREDIAFTEEHYNGTGLVKRAFTVNNAPWASLAKMVIFNDQGYQVHVDGQVQLQTRLRKTRLNIDRMVTIPGTGDVKSKLLAFEFADFSKGQVNLSMNMWIDSVVRMSFDTINMQMRLGDSKVGTATMNKLDLATFDSTKQFNVACTLSLDLLKADPALLGAALSSFYTEPAVRNASTLALYGINVTTSSGAHVTWLDQAVAMAVIPIPNTIPKAIEEASAPFELYFDTIYETPGYNPRIVAKDGFAVTGIQLPEQFNGLAEVLGPASYKIVIKAGEDQLLNITMPALDSVKIPDGYNSTFSNANITVAGGAYAGTFLSQLVNSEEFKLTAEVFVNATSETQLGNISLSGVPKDYTWTVQGLKGFTDNGKNPFELRSLKINPNTNGEELILDAELQINSTSPMGVDLGPTEFKLRTGTSTSIGTADIAHFAVKTGVNRLNMTVIIGKTLQNDPLFARLLLGQEQSLILQDPVASNGDASMTLIDSTFPITAVTQPVNGSSTVLEAIRLDIPTTSGPVLLAMTYRNTFGAPLFIYDVELSVRDAVTDKVYGNVNSIDFRAQKLDTGRASTLEAVLFFNEANSRQQLTVRQDAGTPVRVEGRVNVGWNGGWNLEIPIRKEMVLARPEF